MIKENSLEGFDVVDIKDSHLKLIHRNKNGFNIPRIEEKYKAKYLGEFALKSTTGPWMNQAFSLFYNEKAHPRGSNYFAVYYMYDGLSILDESKAPSVYITNGISAVIDKETGEPIVYEGVVCDNQYVLYSAYRHDYQTYKEFMVDGGREYMRYSGSEIVKFYIKDGEICYKS